VEHEECPVLSARRARERGGRMLLRWPIILLLLVGYVLTFPIRSLWGLIKPVQGDAVSLIPCADGSLPIGRSTRGRRS